MIERVTFHRFKQFADRTLEVHPGVSLLGGGNNAGKSTILHGLAVWEFCRTAIEMERGVETFMAGEKRQGLGLGDDEFSPINVPSLKHLWTNLKSQKVDEPDGYTLKIRCEWQQNGADRHLEFGLSLANDRLFVKATSSDLAAGDRIPRLAYLPPFAGMTDREPRLRGALRRRRIGEGLAGAVLRNVLLDMQQRNLTERQRLRGTKSKISDPDLRSLRTSDPWELLQQNLRRTFGAELDITPFREEYHSYIQVQVLKGTVDGFKLKRHSLDLVGKTAFVDADDEPSFSNHMTRLRARDDIAEGRFIAHLLHGRWRAGDFRTLANNHVSQASVGRTVLAGLQVWLPPLAEQRRIAERLDEIDSRRASVADRLGRAKQIVTRLKTAVLAAACSGRLTADWRDENPDADSVDDPLRILSGQRRRRAEAVNVDLALPDLPASYVTSSIGAASERIEYGTSRRATTDGDIPVLRMTNIQNGAIDTADLKYMTRDDDWTVSFLPRAIFCSTAPTARSSSESRLSSAAAGPRRSPPTSFACSSTPESRIRTSSASGLTLPGGACGPSM